MATIDHRVAPISTIRLPEGGNFALSMTFTGATLTDTSGTVTAQNGESTKRVPLLWSKAGYAPSGSVYSFDIAPATTDDDTVAFSVVTSSGYTDYAFTIYDESGSAPYPIYLRLQGRVEWVPDVGEFEAETEASTAVTVTVDGVEIAVAVTVAGGGGGGAVSDGDKGDITVSSSGTVWTIDDGAVSLAKMANLAESRVIGRATGAGTGAPTALTPAQARQVLDIAGEIQTHNLETVGPHGITTYSATIIAANASSDARTALELGGAATLSVGTTAGTVAAGDDSRFTLSTTTTTSGLSGIVKAASDTLDVAVAGTDYLEPTGSGASLTGIATSVAGRTGAVTLAQADISGLTAASSPEFAGFSGSFLSCVPTFAVNTFQTRSTDIAGMLHTVGFLVANTGVFGFSSDTSWYGTKDVGLARNGAGQIQVNNGTIGNYRDLILRGIKLNAIAISALPSAASSEGWRYEVNDANAPSVGATVASGGSAKCEVRSNGTDWKVLQVF